MLVQMAARDSRALALVAPWMVGWLVRRRLQLDVVFGATRIWMQRLGRRRSRLSWTTRALARWFGCASCGCERCWKLTLATCRSKQTRPLPKASRASRNFTMEATASQKALIGRGGRKRETANPVARAPRLRWTWPMAKSGHREQERWEKMHGNRPGTPAKRPLAADATTRFGNVQVDGGHIAECTTCPELVAQCPRLCVAAQTAFHTPLHSTEAGCLRSTPSKLVDYAHCQSALYIQSLSVPSSSSSRGSGLTVVTIRTTSSFYQASKNSVSRSSCDVIIRYI